MPISFTCPLCRQKVKVSRKDAGTRRDCPACNETIAIPERRTAPEVEDWDEKSGKEPQKEPGRNTAKLIKQFAADPTAPEDEETDEPARDEPPKAPGKMTAKLIKQFAADAPPEADERTPPPAARRLPSAGRVKRPPIPDAPARDASSRNTAIAVLVGVGIFFLGGTAYLLLRKPPLPPPPPPESTPLVVTPTVTPDQPEKKDPEVEAAYARVVEARDLENHGDEVKAEDLFDREIEASRSQEARRSLIAGRRAFLDRCRTTLEQVLADAKFKAMNGKVADAQALLQDHFAHVPNALHEELYHAIDALNEELLARLPNERPRMRAARKPAVADTGAPDERGKFQRLEEALHEAILALDKAAAQKAIDAAGTFANVELARAAERQAICARAALDVADELRDLIAKNVGKSVDLVLWRGTASGKLASVNGNVFAIELPQGGTREIALAEISPATRASYFKVVTPDGDQPFHFGFGVLCLVHGDRAGAREQLAAAPSIEAAQFLAQSLEKDAPAAPKPTPTNPTPTDPVASKPGSGDVTERWPNGNPKKHYARDEKGRIVGLCTEYFEDGKTRVKSHYQQGELEGEYVELYPNGKTSMRATYKKGKLQGEVAYFDQAGKVTQRTWFTDGKVLASKTPDEIKRDLDAIAISKVAFPSQPANTSEFTPLDWEAQAKALRRLRAYRYLCGVPHDVGLSWEYSEYCSAGARLLELVGHLEHTPAQPPGCPDLLYKMGYTGTSKGNLHWNSGGTNAVESVDGFMDDSDPSNVDRVGHRRWCLNPNMGATAFGVHGQYAVMYAFDGSHPTPADRVAYPAAGYFPSAYCHPNLAWSLSFDALHYKPPGSGELQVVVSRADEKYRKLAAVPVEDVNVNTVGFGMALCLIFRPKAPLTAGARYWVEIKGFKKDGQELPIEYFVEFF